MTRKMKDSGVDWIGEMPEEWSIGKLKKYVYLKTGGTPSTKNQEVFEGEFKWFTPGDLNESLILKDSFRHLNKHYVKENIVPIYPPGSVLIVGIGATIGKLGFTTEESSSNQQITAIMSKEHIDSKFLLYMMLANVDVIKETALFTTLPILNNQTLGETLILSLPKKEQIKIAKYLDNKCTKIDETIENQKQVIEKLKEYKQSIITEAVTKGLNPNVKMKDSGVEWIGEIPEHWECRKLKSVSNKIIDGTHSTPNYQDKGIPFLRVTDITVANGTKQDINWNNTAYISEEEHNELIKRCNPQKGDLLVSKNGTIGVPRIVDWNREFSIFVSLCLIKVKENINVEFLYYYFKSSLIWTEIAIGGKTGTITNLHLDKIREFKIPMPKLNEQRTIIDYLDKKCSKIDDSIAQKQRLIEKIKEYKKSLIYECVTGKREV